MRVAVVLAVLALVVGLGIALLLITRQAGDSGGAELEPPEALREVIGEAAPGLPFSPAVRVGDTLSVSGQMAIDPETGIEVRESIEAETERVMLNIERLVRMAGFEMSDVTRATVYLSDIDDYAAMNAVYSRFFPTDPPARACVAVDSLVRGFRLEISCIAQR